MNFSLLDNITLTCLTLGDEDESLDQAVHDAKIDSEISVADEFIDETNPKAGLLKLSEEEVADFLAEMESPSRTPATVVHGLAVSSRCLDTRTCIASLKACTQLAVSKSEELGKLGACQCVAKMTQTHGSESEPALQALGALIGLCQCKDNIQLMEKAGMSAQIVRLIRMHCTNVNIVSWGTNVILLYLKAAQAGEKFLSSSLLNENVFPVLLTLLELKNPCSASASVVENVCRALMLLCPSSVTGSHDQIIRLHPTVSLSDAVVAVDGTANIVQLDGEPVTETMRALLQEARNHFHAALMNTLNDKKEPEAVARSNSSSSVHSVRSAESVAKDKSAADLARAKAMEIRVSKADLLNVVMHLLANSLQTSESNAEVKIRSFDDIFRPDRASGTPRKVVSKPKEREPIAVDKSKVLAFKNALSAALSDEEDKEEETTEISTEPEDCTDDGVVVMDSGSGPDHQIAMEGTVAPSYPLRAESHHSIRFDMPVSLDYRPDISSKKPNRMSQDRSSGNLYFADLQYSMGMARCADYFESLAHKEYMTPPGLDDSGSSNYSAITSISSMEEDSEGGKILSERRLNSCIEKFRVSVSLDPEHVDAMFALAILLLRKSSSVEASEEVEQLFKDIIVLQPEYPKCYYNLGHVFFTRGQFGDSLSCFESAIAIDAKDMEAKIYRALCLTQLGGVANIGAAMNEYRSILEVDSTNYLALFNLGVLLAKMEDYSAAVFTFQNIIMNDPENVDALSVLAKSFQMRAEHALQKINKTKADSGSGVGFVPEHAAVIEDFRRALRCFEQLLRLESVLMESEIYCGITKSIQEILRRLRDLCS